MERGTIISDEPGAHRGGAPSAAPDVWQQTNVVTPRDRVRWGPIFAGLLTALAIFMLANVLLLALGIQGIRVGDPNADAALGTGALISAVIGLLSFLVGGFVAARSAAVDGRMTGALNGFLVWALGLLLLLVLAGLGLGGLIGASGDLFAQYRAAGSPRAEGVSGQEVVRGIREAAFPAFLALALPALAAMAGGYLGAREDRVGDRRVRS